MTCSHVRALAGAYALDALEAAEREAVERHLDVCPACRAFVAQHAEVAASLARLVPPEEPPAELRARILAEARGAPAWPASGRAARSVRGAAWRVAAAVALVALGWAAGRWVAWLPARGDDAVHDELRRVRLERDLWQGLAAPGGSVAALSTVPELSGVVALASVLGDERGCWVRLVADGLPDPEPGQRYVVRVRTLDATPELTRPLPQVAPGRWELETRIDVPPDRLGAVEVVVTGEDGGDPSSRRVAWGYLWAEGEGW